MPKRYENSVVLAFGDTHFPYEHKETFQFLEDIVETYEVDRVIHLGDILDVYSVSAYPTDPDHPDSWTEEIKKARKKVQQLASIFPEMEIMESNHDDRAYKKARLSGIPREYLVPYSKILDAPEGWKWHSELRIRCEETRDFLFFAHTKTGGALACAKDKGCTSVLGHHHTKFGMQGFKANKRTIYGVDAGCLVSDKGSPFKYNKGDRGRPIQGCVLIIEGVPMMVPLT